MTPEQRTERLRQLQAKHKLKPQDIAEMMGRSVPAVYAWLNGTYRITDHSLELLEYKIRGRK